MPTELRPLFPYERNRDDQAPRQTWMFRGVEERLQVPMTYPTYEMGASAKLLVRVEDMGVPDRLVEVAYVPGAEQLCFSLAGFPRTVFSQRIIDPVGEPEPRQALLSRMRNEPPSNPRSFPQVELEADVAGIAATHEYLFVLTREQGRIPERSALELHRFRPLLGQGLRKATVGAPWRLEFPAGGVPGGALRIAVSRVPDRDTLFLAADDGRMYAAPLGSGRELQLRPLPEGAWPGGGGLPALYAPRLGSRLQVDARLVAADAGQGRLYAFGGLLERPSFRSFGVADGLPPAAAVDAWEYNVHEHFPETSPDNLHAAFLVVASPSARQLWTVPLEGGSALPLIGGGRKPYGAKALPNLLDLDIGAVDRVAVIPHAGILFGSSGGIGWLFLLSPSMLEVLDESAESRFGAPARAGGEQDS